MNRQHIAIIAATHAAAFTITSSFYAIANIYTSYDGRSNRNSPSRRFSIQQSQFPISDNNSVYDEGWFRDQFRCSKTSFNLFCTLIEDHWIIINTKINHNATFFIRDRVAVTLYYLTHMGSIVDAAKMFGMSKSSAIRYIWQVVDIIIYCLQSKYIQLPKNESEWNQIINGFEEICNFPNCCFAIDGSLIEIERPYDYEGWYCRKRYPAINCQVIVDYKTRIISYDLRPGSANDKSIFNYSTFGKSISKLLLTGKYGIGDAGYTLSPFLIIPYPIKDNMPQDESNFNYLHSKTRIVVERTFGMIKNRFRILKSPLNQKEDLINKKSQTEQMAKIIEACFILHNLFISFNDVLEITLETNDDLDDNIIIDTNNDNIEQLAIIKRDQIKNYLYNSNF